MAMMEARWDLASWSFSPLLLHWRFPRWAVQRVQAVRSAVTGWTTPRRLIPKRASGEHPLSAALNDILGRTAGQRSNQQLGCADPPWPLGALGSNARLMLVRGVQL